MLKMRFLEDTFALGVEGKLNSVSVQYNATLPVGSFMQTLISL